MSGMLSLGRELPNFVDANIDLNQVDCITYDVVDPGGLGPIKTLPILRPSLTSG